MLVHPPRTSLSPEGWSYSNTQGSGGHEAEGGPAIAPDAGASHPPEEWGQGWGRRSQGEVWRGKKEWVSRGWQGRTRTMDR
eukprot:8272355-Pyramimonas_sp.AAC.1